jgi:hypothetical protein
MRLIILVLAAIIRREAINPAQLYDFYCNDLTKK